MAHTVTITRVPDETGGDYEYEFGGSHGRDCEYLLPCDRRECQAMEPYVETTRTRHGKEHTYTADGLWVVLADDCALRFVFDDMSEAETFSGLTVGTYPIQVCFDDAWWIEVPCEV